MLVEFVEWLMVGMSWLAAVSLPIYALHQQVRALERRVRHTQELLRQVAERLGLPEDPLAAEIRELVARGKTVEAIQRVCKVRGLTLKEAKEFVDSI
ncbi:MAG: hypothetical protein L6E13_13075 [Firmicutes bacterium]|nr:hypothetical protein [Bacillota bacterium]